MKALSGLVALLCLITLALASDTAAGNVGAAIKQARLAASKLASPPRRMNQDVPSFCSGVAIQPQPQPPYTIKKPSEVELWPDRAGVVTMQITSTEILSFEQPPRITTTITLTTMVSGSAGSQDVSFIARWAKGTTRANHLWQFAVDGTMTARFVGEQGDEVPLLDLQAVLACGAMVLPAGGKPLIGPTITAKRITLITAFDKRRKSGIVQPVLNVGVILITEGEDRYNAHRSAIA